MCLLQAKKKKLFGWTITLSSLTKMRSLSDSFVSPTKLKQQFLTFGLLWFVWYVFFFLYFSFAFSSFVPLLYRPYRVRITAHARRMCHIRVGIVIFQSVVVVVVIFFLLLLRCTLHMCRSPHICSTRLLLITVDSFARCVIVANYFRPASIFGQFSPPECVSQYVIFANPLDWERNKEMKM